MMRAVTFAGTSTVPRSVETRTVSPFAMPSFFASPALIQSC